MSKTAYTHIIQKMYIASIAVLVSSVSLSALAQNTSNLQLARLNTAKTPPNFEQLNQTFYAQFQAPLTNSIYLYYEGKFLETAKVTLNQQQLQLTVNDLAISQLPLMATLKTEMIAALKQPLALASQNESQEKYYCILLCDQIESQQLGLRYRPHKLDATFVLPTNSVKDYYQYQKQHEKTDFTFSPQSAVLNLDAGSRGSIQEGNHQQEQYLNYLFNGLYQQYSLTNSRNSAGKKESFASYALANGNLLSAGRINAQLAIPFAQEFYGVELSSENLRYPVQRTQEYIYEDYFPTSTQLDVYINDKLVMQQNISQGYQQIGGGNLPAGDYDARLVFTDIYGQRREVMHRIHRSDFPSLFRRAPQWLVQVGSMNTPPEVARKDFASLMYGRQFTDKFAARAQLSTYNGATLAKLQTVYEHNRLLSDLSVSSVDSHFYRATLTETLRRNWGNLKYQWDYAKANQQSTLVDNDNQRNLTDILDENVANNAHYLSADYRLTESWWLGAGVSIAEQENQDPDLVQGYVHSSKYLKTGLFKRPAQLFVEFNHRKPTSNTNKQGQNVFRLSISQSFELGRRTQLYGRVASKQFVEAGQDSVDTNVTLTSQAINKLEQSYSLNNQWQHDQHSFNTSQRYKHEFAELSGQYQVDQSCADCASTQRYGASLRTTLSYNQQDVTAFRNERGSAGVMVDNQTDAPVKFDVSGIAITVPPHTTRGLSMQPYVMQAIRYQTLSDSNQYNYLMQPANTAIKIRPNEVAKFTLTQYQQYYVAVSLRDKQNQAIAAERVIIKPINSELMTDEQGGIIIPLNSAQALTQLEIEVKQQQLTDKSSAERCLVTIPMPLDKTYRYLGDITCE
ncbi:hypothetical protein [Agitococcus lubricus]|uniref:Outer membrane usher protein FimD/PapC n=1 Tax=Agitococcus lubricus TaxID=1077255 RepID=A0A2T5J406_9GAMM|nr:hypothetical protein [Agitococcus lubricus]PTQ91331.1 outer membrane usher protein FimD/PapC [Agitococcus lubricus]